MFAYGTGRPALYVAVTLAPAVGGVLNVMVPES